MATFDIRSTSIDAIDKIIVSDNLRIVRESFFNIVTDEGILEISYQDADNLIKALEKMQQIRMSIEIQ